MFNVGDYVKYEGVPNSRIGMVVKVNKGYVDVFFRRPTVRTIGILTSLLELATREEYEEHNGIVNPTIKFLGTSSKSIEQEMENLFWNLTKDDFDKYREKQCEEFFGVSKYIYGRPERKFNKEWNEALKQAYIDMALATGDEEWFNQLVKGDK